MSEVRLQSDIAVEYSRRYPKLQGQLFHVSNERNNKIQAFQARAIGIIPGVSDFIYFELFHPKENGSSSSLMIGMEVKEVGSRHEVQHLKNQLKWGKTLENCGGRYFIVRSVDEAMDVIEGRYLSAINIEEFERIISECKTKTLKF